MLTFFLFIFILSLLILIHEFGHFAAARKIGVRVEQFCLGFGPQLLKKKKNHTQYSINAIPLGGFVKLAGDDLEEYKGEKFEYYSQPPGKRFWIVFSGPMLNYILGILFFWIIFFVGFPTLTTKVGGLLEGFGAKEAGLKVGDKIASIDGKAVGTWDELQEVIHRKKGVDKVRLWIERNNEVFSLDVRIKEKELDDALGQKKNVGLLGITPFGETIEISHGFLESFFLGVKEAWNITLKTYTALWRMITGKLSVRESVTGPVGIFFITSQMAKLGVVAVLHLIAALNISLAIFNLLPLPILDGGHILFLCIEKIRAKTLSLKTERIITRIGLTMIVSLAVLVTYNDILKFFGDKIIKFFK